MKKLLAVLLCLACLFSLAACSEKKEPPQKHYVSLPTVSKSGSTVTNYEYDKNGNLLCVKQSDGIWWEYEYDEKDRLICEKKSDGTVKEYEYEQNDNLTFQGHFDTELGLNKDENALVVTDDGIKREYDEAGNLIYKESSYGYWWNYEYDQHGNRTYLEDSEGDWKKYVTFSLTDAELETLKNNMDKIPTVSYFADGEEMNPFVFFRF